MDVKKEGAGRLVLPAILDLTAAPGLKDQTLAALGLGMGLTLDAEAVTRLTTPCLQVLAAAAIAAAQMGGPGLTIENAPPAFAEIVAGLGLSEILKLEPSHV